MKVKNILFVFLLLSFACKTENKKSIKESYPDGSPKIEHFYKDRNDEVELTKQLVYYPDKKVMSEGYIKNKKMEGKWTYYHKNGKKWSEGYFKDGLEEGLRTAWFENGSKYYEGNFKNGKRVGYWNFYDDKGKLLKTLKQD